MKLTICSRITMLLLAAGWAPAISPARAQRSQPAMSDRCVAIAQQMAAAAAEDPADRVRLARGRAEGAALGAAAAAAPQLMGGGFAGGLAAEILIAQRASRIADAEIAQMKSIDRTTDRIAAIEARYVAAGCD